MDVVFLSLNNLNILMKPRYRNTAFIPAAIHRNSL
jgi:hypothetical protein